MFDTATVILFLITLAIGMIILRYLCSFAFGLFCYNPPKPTEEREITPVVTPENIIHVSEHRIIRVTHDTPTNQKILPIAIMV
jgi:hypothetical protein